jgi:hypothetical protein
MNFSVGSLQLHCCKELYVIIHVFVQTILHCIFGLSSILEPDTPIADGQFFPCLAEKGQDSHQPAKWQVAESTAEQAGDKARAPSKGKGLPRCDTMMRYIYTLKSISFPAADI